MSKVKININRKEGERVQQTDPHDLGFAHLLHIPEMEKEAPLSVKKV